MRSPQQVPARDLPALASVVSAFQIPGSYAGGAPHGSGHINDTFVVATDEMGRRVRYILQRINTHVFREPWPLMENVVRVTEAAMKQLAADGVADASRRTLSVVRARDGRPLHFDPEGGAWRCYGFIENARTCEVIETEAQAFEAARAFGDFQRLVAHLDGPRLHATIPDFHHTRARFERLREAVESDAHGRRAGVTAEWDFVRKREPLTDIILDLMAKGDIPERVTHNDTKLNNVMIDDATQSALCVVDLDTVMPGSALYDFGDMVRTATSPAAEDEIDVSKVRMQMPMFAALVRGFLGGTRGMLNATERAHLVLAGKLITLECGIRFLTDHLAGDTYFKIQRPGHNLDRCRTQFALVASIEAQEDEMRRMVEAIGKSDPR